MKKYFLFILFATLIFEITPSLTYAQSEQQIDQYKGTATGTNSYSVTITQVTTVTPYDGQKLLIRFTNGNSGASTLKVNSMSAIAINLNASALVSGDIPAGAQLLVIYNLTTSKWDLYKNGISGAGTVSTVTVTPNAGVTGVVTNPTTTPSIAITLGAITPTTVNGNTLTTGSSTFTGTAGQTYTFPSTTSTLARTDAGQTFTGVSNATSWNLTTPVLGTPSSGTLTNCTGLPSGAGITCTATNNSASAGQLGEYISSAIAVGSSISLTTNTPVNVTSISLTAGDWDVTVMAYFQTNGTTATVFESSISQTSATMDETVGAFNNFPIPVASHTNDISLAVSTYRKSLSGTTTIYLVSNSKFTVGTVSAYGLISARRVR